VFSRFLLFDSHLVQMSRDDTGATRITDVERNLLVASTDMIGGGLDHRTVQQRSRSSLRDALRDRAETIE
jgi:hypothetical protein